MDAAFLSHHDYRGHSGRMISLGAGAVIGSSMEQIINGKSSIDNETIAVDDFMGTELNTLYFTETQCHNMTRNIMFQDN